MRRHDAWTLAMKATLLGLLALYKIQATSGFRPDPATLAEPLEWGHDVIKGFSSGCGTKFELIHVRLKVMAARGELRLSDYLAVFYLLVDGCNECDGPDGAIRLMSILEAPTDFQL